jgi:hypothetical protein
MQPSEVPVAQEEFREQRRRKRNSTDDKFKKSQKKFIRPPLELSTLSLKFRREIPSRH